MVRRARIAPERRRLDICRLRKGSIVRARGSRTQEGLRTWRSIERREASCRCERCLNVAAVLQVGTIFIKEVRQVQGSIVCVLCCGHDCHTTVDGEECIYFIGQFEIGAHVKMSASKRALLCLQLHTMPFGKNLATII